METTPDQKQRRSTSWSHDNFTSSNGRESEFQVVQQDDIPTCTQSQLYNSTTTKQPSVRNDKRKIELRRALESCEADIGQVNLFYVKDTKQINVAGRKIEDGKIEIVAKAAATEIMSVEDVLGDKRHFNLRIGDDERKALNRRRRKEKRRERLEEIKREEDSIQKARKQYNQKLEELYQDILSRSGKHGYTREEFYRMVRGITEPYTMQIDGRIVTLYPGKKSDVSFSPMSF